ncbi:anti-sigma factor family protein [Tabrizicola sp.]|uniref:anti-sigma factor family protein n=1 Tax=Tabrizicola sp. TaxID=2005166 RepID=UPI003F390BF5
MTTAPDLATRLSAYRDGELPEAEARAVAALLAKDPVVQAEYDTLLRADDAIDKAFAAMLHDPVPEALLQSLERAELAPQPANSPFPPRWGMALAASVALLMVGGVGGSYLTRQMAPPQELAAGWLDQVAEYHLVYAAQSRHLVEVPASEQAHLETWLSEQTGVAFAVPDLAASGLTFQGARLLVASGKPVAQLMYTDAAGQVIAVCFMAGGDAALGDGLSPLATRNFDALDMVSWKSRDASYVVVGPKGAAGLDTVAETASLTL